MTRFNTANKRNIGSIHGFRTSRVLEPQMSSSFQTSASLTSVGEVVMAAPTLFVPSVPGARINVNRFYGAQTEDT